MIGLVALLAAGAVAWKFMAPGEQFLPAFARLLAGAAIERGHVSFFSGRSYATGRFREREVAIRLQLKRSRHGQGYLVVALRTAGTGTFNYDGIDARVRDDAGRRGLQAIAAQDLLVSVEEGWLKSLWRPQGFMIFPGQFSEARWRGVLEAMTAVAASLDASA